MAKSQLSPDERDPGLPEVPGMRGDLLLQQPPFLWEGIFNSQDSQLLLTRGVSENQTTWGPLGRFSLDCGNSMAVNQQSLTQHRAGPALPGSGEERSRKSTKGCSSAEPVPIPSRDLGVRDPTRGPGHSPGRQTWGWKGPLRSHGPGLQDGRRLNGAPQKVSPRFCSGTPGPQAWEMLRGSRAILSALSSVPPFSLL